MGADADVVPADPPGAGVHGRPGAVGGAVQAAGSGRRGQGSDRLGAGGRRLALGSTWMMIVPSPLTLIVRCGIWASSMKAAAVRSAWACAAVMAVVMVVSVSCLVSGRPGPAAGRNVTAGGWCRRGAAGGPRRPRRRNR